MLVLTGAAAMFIGDGLAARSSPRLRRLIHGHHSGNLQVAAEYKAARTTSQEKPPVNESENEPNTTFSPKTSALFVQSLNVTTLQGASLVKNVTLDIGPGEILGLVGESGSGKSLTAMSAAGLIPDGVNATAQILQVAGHNLLDRTNPSDIARDVAMVYQDPMSSFNPALSLGSQLTEVPRVHLRQSRKKSRAELVHKFRQLQISNPEKRVSQRAHELSGGMLQRAMISSALLTEAKVIIADEPTTALDVTVQAEVLRQFVNASESLDAAVLFISHDLGVIGALCDRVLVMKEGEVVEELTRTQLHHENIRHPYTKSLLEAAKYVKPLTEPDANR